MRVAEDRRRLDAIRDRLRGAGKRWTVAKGATVETLLATPGHLSVQQIHETIAARFPQIDRSTVHRVLLSLADDHVVHVLGQHGEARYGLADEPHHHALCVDCGKVVEIRGATVQRLVNAAGRETGFRFEEGGITLPGRCGSCAP